MSEKRIQELEAQVAQMVEALKLGMEYIYSCREEFPSNSQGEKQCDADQKRLEQALSTSAESTAKFLAERDAKMWGEPVVWQCKAIHSISTTYLYDNKSADLCATTGNWKVIPLYRKGE